MSHSAARARPGQDRVSLYEEITNKIITELEARAAALGPALGSICVSAPLAMPKNAAHRPRLLGHQRTHPLGRVVPAWLRDTKLADLSPAAWPRRQCPQRRAPAPLCLCRPFRSRSGTPPAPRALGDEAVAVPFLKRFTVFNAAQCDGSPRRSRSLSRRRSPDGLNHARRRGPDPRQPTDLALAQRQSVLLPDARLHSGAAARGLFQTINWHRTALHKGGSLDRPSVSIGT